MAGPDHDRPTVHLGTVTPGVADEHRPPPRSTPGDVARRWPWRQWTTVAAALAVGVVIGVVGNEARDDSQALADVRIAGTVVGPVPGLPNGELGPFAVELVNLGQDDVQIVGVTAAGFRRPDGAESPEPVTAEPGRWVHFETSTFPDCTAQPPDDVEVRLRTDAGTRTVPLSTPSAAAVLQNTWHNFCDAFRDGQPGGRFDSGFGGGS